MLQTCKLQPSTCHPSFPLSMALRSLSTSHHSLSLYIYITPTLRYKSFFHITIYIYSPHHKTMSTHSHYYGYFYFSLSLSLSYRIGSLHKNGRELLNGELIEIEKQRKRPRARYLRRLTSMFCQPVDDSLSLSLSLI